MRLPLFIIKYIYYEYWPWWLFYVPMLPLWFYLSLRNRSFAYFSVTNPGIYLGGFFGESKKDIMALIDNAYMAQSVYIENEIDFESVKSKIKNMPYPLIAKPDIGERGNDVEKIIDAVQLQQYHSKINAPYIIQEFITYDIELGILYSRMPNEEKGIVSSVTFKKFMSVTGDGVNTVLQLMQKNTQSRFQIKRMLSEQNSLMQSIPAKGETLLLEPIGNHCRGTAFVNYNHIINDDLHRVFDNICKPIQGFYYGRFDLKVKSIEDLYKGENIKIMELNGASSEPGHLYDKHYTLLKAYKDLSQHWIRLSNISRYNMRNGYKPVSFSTIVKTYFKFIVFKK